MDKVILEYDKLYIYGSPCLRLLMLNKGLTLLNYIETIYLYLYGHARFTF